MGDEEEVGGRVADPEAHLLQAAGGDLPGAAHLGHHTAEVGIIPDGRRRPRLGQPIHGVGVKGVLHAVEGGHQAGAAHGVAHPQAGQGPGL